MSKYRCPNCSARARFNIINQVVTPVKFDMETGEMHTIDNLDPFHLSYNGPERRVQCAACGLVEDEIRFEKMAQIFNRNF